MKGIKLILGAVMAFGLVIGMVNPTPSLAADAPLKIQPNNFNRMGLFMGQYFQGSMHEIIAEELGMTTEELFEARLAGKTIAELLKEKDIAVDGIVKAVMAEREAVLDEMVKAKTITKEQKALMLENMEAMVDGMLITEGVGPRGNGGGYYRGGGCPMMPDFQPRMGRGRMGGGPMWR